MRLIDSCMTQLEAHKELLGPVSREKEKKKKPPQLRDVRRPLSSEHGAYKTVKARFWH